MLVVQSSRLTVFGLALLAGCGNSPSASGDDAPNRSTGMGGTNTTSMTASANSNPSGIVIPIATNTVGGSTTRPQIFGGSTSGGTDAGSGDAVGTLDPPAAAVGGDSSTSEPPSGSTSDPPSGDTGDPPGGNTDDPPGGDTGDPPGGDTGDPPGGDTGDPPGGDTGDPPGGNTPDPPASCTLTEIDKVNVIVFENATPTGADAEGRMWVGGDLTITGGYAVNTTSISTLKSSCDDWGLVVGGNITGDPIVSSGKAAYGGTFKGTASMQSHCGLFHQTPIDFDALETKLTGYSEAFKTYPTNGTNQLTYGQLVLTGTDKTLNVFSVTAEQISSITSLKFVVPTTSTVIVNVSGKAINWPGGSFILPDGGQACKANNSDWCHRILYNMYEAESVTINGIGIQGSILAPKATFNGLGGNVDGQVIVRNLKGVTEYHPYYFSGCWLLPKPKP